MSLEAFGMGQAVLDASLDAIVVTDATGRVIEFNPAAERLFGHRRDAALGRRIGELIVPAHHRAAHEAGMARYAAGESSRVVGHRMQLEALHADGHVFPVELAIVEAEGEGGRIFAASLRDLTERRAQEAELHARQEFLRALVDDQSDLVIRSDAEGRILFCNAEACRFYDLAPEALVGTLFPPGGPAEAQDRLRAELPALTPEAPLRRLVARQAMADGTLRWLDWSNRAIFDAAGGRAGYISVGRDITAARDRAETLERVSRQNALYRRIFEAMPDAIHAKDLEGRFIAANAAMAASLGAPSAEALIGRSKADFLPPEMARSLDAAEQDFLASGDEGRIQTLPTLQADGAEGWQLSRKTLFRDEAGQVIGLIGHSRDVTDQLRAERGLAQSEARFAAFVDNAPVAMFLKDGAGRYLVLNVEACRVIGRPLHQVIGRTVREVSDAAAAERIMAADLQVLETGQPLSTTGELAAPGLPYHWAMTMRFPVAAPDGKGRWIGGFAIDLTAQRAAELDLERSREALHQSEKLNAMGSLLAGVAHELNNPLAIVVAQAALLEEEARGGPLGLRAEKIRAAGERCGRIAKTFLGLARRRPTETRRASLNDMARAAVDLMGYSLHTSGMTVDLQLDRDLPEIEGDADLLAQVVLNLVVNAQQAMDGRPGPRVIRVVTRASSQGVGGAAVIEVADSGPGVPEAIRSRIFEPFFTTKPQGGGSGVGLSFCLNVVTAHQGLLELVAPDQALGQALGPALGGAIFRVTLPAAVERPAAPQPAPDTGPAAGSGLAGPGAGRRPRALVVDDEPGLVEVLAELLEDEGYATETALSVAEAQARIRQNPDLALIFSDLRMPQLDGPAFYAWLSAEYPSLLRRLAFVTGDALGAAAAGFLSRVDRPCLEKPFCRESLARVLAEMEAGAI